jgi:hypothetical protein
MKLLRSLGLLLCLAISNVTFGQTVDPISGLQTTGNILDLGGGLPWTNTVTGAAGGFSGGCIPAYNPSTGNIIFGYTSQTVSQSISINQALATAGTGIQLAGYKYSWSINNELAAGSNKGTLIGNVSLTAPGGSILESYNYDYSQTNTATNAFQDFSGTQLFTNKYQLSTVDKITVSFTGKDQNFWAGYYGPRVHVNDFSLLYSVDPCATNPAYSSTCSGFNTILNTNNLLDSTKGGPSLNQAFAINTALENAGIGAMVHGFNYGFNYRVGQSFSGCTATNQDGSCSWYMNIPAYVNASVSLTNNSSKPQLLYSQNYSFSGDGTSGSVSEKFLLPTSLNQSMLGMGRITGSASGTGSSIEGAWATLIYTPDPCSTNPLYSPTCSGYGAAIAKQLSSATSPETSSTTSPATNSTTDTTGITDTSVISNASTGNVAVTPTIVSAPAPTVASTSSSTTTNTSTTSSQSTKESTSSNTSLALSLISKNQEKEKEIAMTASQNAIQAAEQASAEAQQEALSVASQSVVNSVTAGSSAVRTDSLSNSSRGGSANGVVNTDSMAQSNQAGISIGLGPAQTSNSASYQQEQVAAILTPVVTTSQVTNTVQIANPTITNNNESAKTAMFELPLLGPALSPVVQQTQVNTQTTAVQQPTTATQITQDQQSNAIIQLPYTLLSPQQATIQPYVAPIVSYELFTPASTQPTQTQSTPAAHETVALLSPNFLTDKSNPLTDIVEAKQTIPQNSTISTVGPSVNGNAGDNDVAGGVSLNKMALAPVGYGDYLNLTLRDAAFYAPKEVYRNQRNVDNQRALRLLTNDSKHKEMVEMQYAR